MDLQRILQNPEIIKDLSTQDKTKLYMQLNDLKTNITNKLNEHKAKKEVLEKQKAEVQEELFKSAGVTNMESLITYVSELQTEFNIALEKQSIELSDVMSKLNM